jgi:hypothetical protein
VITVDQFRAATFQLPHGTPEEFRLLTQDVMPNLIDQPWPTTDRSNSRCQYSSLMNRITISTCASLVNRVGSNKKCRDVPLTVVRHGKEQEL